MAKYVLECTQTFETVIPADKIVEVDRYGVKHVVCDVPEIRHVTKIGTLYTVKRKDVATDMLASGQWRQVK